jgi:hypothetical protein
MKGGEKWGDENDDDKKQEKHEEDDCSKEKGESGVEEYDGDRTQNLDLMLWHVS